VHVFTVPCNDIDYILKTYVNDTKKNTTVYVDSGMYNVSIVSHSQLLINSPFYPFGNIIFILTGDISSSSSVKSNDISTYPIILSNSSVERGSDIFLFSSNISASFQYIKFVIGNNSYQSRYFIRSFLLFYFSLILIF
jgi:hypothetical protein